VIPSIVLILINDAGKIYKLRKDNLVIYIISEPQTFDDLCAKYIILENLLSFLVLLEMKTEKSCAI
jgi:hypothetical protein